MKPLERARGFERHGRLDDALAAYREAAAADPSAGEPRIRIVGLLLLRGRAAEAESEARAFVAQSGSADAHATLGQLLRLGSRHEEALSHFQAACARDPASPGLRRLLNDGLRSRYWSQSAALTAELRVRFESGRATPAEGFRYYHLRFLGLLSPDVQRWLMNIDQEALPDATLDALDRQAGLSAVLKSCRALREHGPYAAAAARVTTESETLEGSLSDSDMTILGGLEVVEASGYSIVPFGDLRSVEVREPGAYFKAALRDRGGRDREVEMPALYYFTEWCRSVEVREGRLTVWRTIADPLRVALGLKDFELTRADKTFLIGLDRIRRIEFA